MADKWSQFDSQIFGVQERILFVVIGDGHAYFVHSEVLEEYWELLSYGLVGRMLLGGVL